MICPKCGFDQPDDIYCAFCGINVETYLQQKRKKRQKAYVLTALVGVAALLIATYVISVHHIDTPMQVGKLGVTPPEAKRDRVASTSPPSDRSLRQSKPQEAPSRPDTGQDDRPLADEQPRKSAMDQEGPESTDKPQGKTFTPAEWFEKGRALDDESEAEVEYYEKAIALDPEFAPAYFRLGAIQYRRANHELADQQFAKFLKYASEADKEAHNIYVYYSPADVERLSEDKEEKQIPTEEVKKETPSKTEEVKKETSSETEGAEEETDLESEEEEEETPWETEGDQKETSSEDEEETGEEESEEVMTIVRFFPVDGHVVVPALFNGHVEARVLVDTGSGITVLSRELAEQIQLEEEPGNGITLKTMAMDIQAGLATLNSIQVGDLIQNNLHVAITDVPSGEEQKFDAILGMDFLNKYEIHIDNQNNRIELRSVREEK